jgi:hypothetical protein
MDYIASDSIIEWTITAIARLRLRGQQTKSSIVKLDRIQLAKMLQRQTSDFTLLHWALLDSTRLDSFSVTRGIQEFYAKQIGLPLQHLRLTRFDLIQFG